MVKTFQAYLPTKCHRTYSCVHCRAHLANHDELISKVVPGFSELGNHEDTDETVKGAGHRSVGNQKIDMWGPEDKIALPGSTVARQVRHVTRVHTIQSGHVLMYVNIGSPPDSPLLVIR
ncbi:protein yippee-like [Plakobranchus ocellatus]|uniref:Protein yippee-like n=1 Tax=Plakobranchus ocellatus TaxID=259542 RepID=A0AAV4C0Z6_9GAST|nr:protein yippee-like [Plakobranchus ocellatus]